LKPDESACPACGFKLIGSTQRFEPVDVDSDATYDATPNPVQKVEPVKKARLIIVRGPQINMYFDLNDSTYKIGRSPKCDIFLNDMTVSRDHAGITPQSDGFEIEDHGSYNGIWINNNSVDKAVLKDGDIVQIGAFCLLYQE
jgi:pSer/pThr/pTyr-binding forkhead associated (FHA) protein